MANALYPKFKEALLQGSVNMSSSDVKAILVDGADYTYSASHEFLSDVAAGGREEISAALGSKTFTNGTFDSADTSWPGASGDVSEIVLLVVGDTSTPASCRLVAYYDTGVTGLPITLNGGDVSVAVNASGWFSL